MIEKIVIERFKNITRIDLDLDNINVLVGANNSGKSSILQSIQFAISIAQTTSLEEFKNAKWSNNKLSTSLTPNQIIYTPLRDVYSLGNGGSLSQKRSNSISLKFLEKETALIANFLLSKGRNKNLLTEIEGKELGNKLRNIENPFSIYVPGLAGIPAFEELKSEGIIRRAAAKGDANNVFRNILWLLRQDEIKWNSFVNDFKDVFSKLSLSVNFDKLKDEYINVSVSDGIKSLPIDAFGTGVLQTVQILSYIHLYNPKILILDEPDSHLHPSNQRIIAEKLSEITLRLNFQIILSTHSRHLLDALKDYASVKWISNGQINTQPYNFISVLLDIGALDRGDLLNNGQTKCVVLTEDSKTNLLSNVLESNGFNLTETEIWPYDGCSKLDTAIVLAAFIKDKAPAIKVIVHRDRDYLTQEQVEKIKTKANLADIDIFFTIGTDIESHYLNANHIKFVYNNLSIEEIEDLIIKSTNETGDKSKENFINSITQEALKAQYAGGAKVNNGQISLQCIQDYEANKERFRHGKRVFKNFRNKIQQTKGQKELITISEHLKCAEIENIKNRIWNN
ncbi:MAG: ATP-dependent nuclease [Breznakibacter sp.]